MADECRLKLGEDPEKIDSVFKAICELFDFLPIAATINDRILCVHSGIYPDLKIEDLNNIKKPYIPGNSKQITEILWSVPDCNKSDYGENNYSSQFRKYSYTSDTLKEVLKSNKLDLIIRSKDYCDYGFEKLFDGRLFSIFSASNYCGHVQNDGGIIYVKKNLEIQPKLIPCEEGNNNWIMKKDMLALYPATPRKTKKKSDSNSKVY